VQHSNRKNKYKKKGSILLSTALALIVWIFIAQSMFMTSAGSMSIQKASRAANQAQQYAEIDANTLRLMAYDDLDTDGAHARQSITSVTDAADWEDEVSLTEEKLIDEDIQSKQRIATINIYKKGDTLSRCTLEVPLSSQGSGIPIGAIMAWNLETPPQYDGGSWLECNGQAVDTNKYRKLASMMQNVPDYRGVFLRGLGNITIPDSYYGSVNHSSNSLDTIQGDSSRELDGGVGYLLYGSTTHGGDGGGVGFHPPGSQLMSKNQPFWHPDHSIASQIYSYAIPQSNYSDYEYYSTSYTNVWYNALTKYEYTLEGNKDSGVVVKHFCNT
jgi:hypothetical protein